MKETLEEAAHSLSKLLNGEVLMADNFIANVGQGKDKLVVYLYEEKHKKLVPATWQDYPVEAILTGRFTIGIIKQ